jgi:hypothetical protein
LRHMTQPVGQCGYRHLFPGSTTELLFNMRPSTNFTS